MKKLKILVSGYVQGVWFRAYTKKIADSLNVKGHVRNLPNGDVEIIAKIENEAVDQFLTKLKIGPPAARVDAIEATKISEAISDESFQITY